MSWSLADVLAPTKGAAWPFRNVFNMMQVQGRPDVTPDVKGTFSGGTLRPWHSRISDYVGIQFGSLPKIAIAALCWNFTVDMDAAAQGYNFSWNGWVMKIVLRDLLLMLVVCGGWDWLLYSSPLRERLAPYKYNDMYPDSAQNLRDRFWTTSATLLASVQEVLLMRWWAGGFFKHAMVGSDLVAEKQVPWGTANPFFGNVYTPAFILWTMTMLYWRIAHFYFIHRAMHPWWNRENTLFQGDLGAALYRYVHSHHHKSYNPTSWSGVSMLPIESITYLSAALIPLMFRCGCHPWLHLYTKLDLIIGAQIGHDGFDAPGGGSYFHQLHHAHFECNYGDSAGIPLDWIFGTFEDGSSFANTSSAEKSNKAPLLAASERPILMEEVAKHRSREDCWIVLHGTVLDVTSFLADHPGGEKILLMQGGKDATKMFQSVHEKAGGFALVEKWAPTAPIGYVSDWTEPAKDSGANALENEEGLWHHIAAQVLLNAAFLGLCAASWYLVMGEI
jgi:sterol desaturase/sphingolipid hydroxylase (fatty acid hydroxylase superfamily)